MNIWYNMDVELLYLKVVKNLSIILGGGGNNRV